MAPNSPLMFFSRIHSYPFVILNFALLQKCRFDVFDMFLLQALMFPFLSFDPLDDPTTVRRSQIRTACRRRLSDVARSAASPPKDCGSTGPSSIRSPAHLRWRCTLSTLAAGRWSRSPVWSSLSRTVSSLIPDNWSKTGVFYWFVSTFLFVPQIMLFSSSRASRPVVAGWDQTSCCESDLKYFCYSRGNKELSFMFYSLKVQCVHFF